MWAKPSCRFLWFLVLACSPSASLLEHTVSKYDTLSALISGVLNLRPFIPAKGFSIRAASHRPSQQRHSVPSDVSVAFPSCHSPNLKVGKAHLYWQESVISQIHRPGVFNQIPGCHAALTGFVMARTRNVERDLRATSEPAGNSLLGSTSGTSPRLHRRKSHVIAFHSSEPSFFCCHLREQAGVPCPWKLIKLPSGELGAPTADITPPSALALLSPGDFTQALRRKASVTSSTTWSPRRSCCRLQDTSGRLTKPSSLSPVCVGQHSCRRTGWWPFFAFLVP